MCPFWKAPRHSKTTESGVNLDFLKHTKEGFTLGIWRIHPAHKKIMTKDSSHGMCFFFLSLGGWRLRFLYICQGFGKVVDLGAELKSWCPRKKGYDGRSGKKKYGMAKRGVFWIFSSTLFSLKMYSSFVPSCLRFWWMGWWGGSLEKAWTRISQQWDFWFPKNPEITMWH